MFNESVGCPVAAMAGRLDPPFSEKENGRDDLILQGRRILIVEDESLIALLIMDALEDAGASIVGPCYTLAECMRVAQSSAVDAAVLDVDLAGEDVFPAATELKKRGVPFVFHTAHGDRQELRALFGDVQVCRKPVEMDELVSVLARISSRTTN